MSAVQTSDEDAPREARSEAHIEFDEAYFARLRKWDDFWWHRAIRQLVTDLPRRHFPSLAIESVADIGCGTGAMMHAIETALRPKRLVGVDIAQAGLLLAQRNHERRHLVRGSIFEIPLGGAQFDLVTCLSVLHHLPSGSDDRTALGELRRILRAGGGLILTASSRGWWNPLRQDDPEENYHPYSIPELAARLREVGFEVTRATYFNASLVPVEWVKRFLTFRAKAVHQDAGLSQGLHHGRTPRWVKLADWVQYMILRSEAALVSRTPIRVPFGLQAVCTALKR